MVQQPNEQGAPGYGIRKKRNWLDDQFLNTSFVVLILFAICCGNLALIFSILGLAMCTEPQAKKNAKSVLIVSIITSVVGFVIGMAMLVAQTFAEQKKGFP